MAETMTARQEFDLLYGWLPEGARDVFFEAWVENPETAWEVVRTDPRYGEWFPGNLTDDGRVRLSEEDYAATVADYDDIFREVGIDPALFRPRYGDLIAGEVTPDELAEDRIGPLYDRVVASSDAIRTYYADTYGIPDMTAEAFVAGVLDPDLGSRILTKQIGIAEIGGEALESGFDITAEFAEDILEAGFGRGDADRVFSRADIVLPTLQTLAERHSDPDDDFDIYEFSSAMFFSDPTQIRRIRRLQAQESSLFSNVTGDVRFRRRNDLGVSGLTEL